MIKLNSTDQRIFDTLELLSRTKDHIRIPINLRYTSWNLMLNDFICDSTKINYIETNEAVRELCQCTHVFIQLLMTKIERHEEFIETLSKQNENLYKELEELRTKTTTGEDE